MVMTKLKKNKFKCETCNLLDEMIFLVSQKLNGAYKVRPIKWIKHDVVPVLLMGETFFGIYMIYRTDKDFRYKLIGSNFSGNCDDLSRAKEECEINFHTRLQPILIPATLTIR